MVSEDLTLGGVRKSDKDDDGDRAGSEGESPIGQPPASPTRGSSLSPPAQSESRTSPPMPLWIRQPGVIHPTAIFPSPSLSFMEQQQQIVNRFYEQRLAQQRRYFQHPSEELSPMNLKNEES